MTTNQPDMTPSEWIAERAKSLEKPALVIMGGQYPAASDVATFRLTMTVAAIMEYFDLHQKKSKKKKK